MEKLIRKSAMIAAILMGISLMLILMTVPLQRALAEYLLGYPGEQLELFPFFPVLTFGKCLLSAVCVALVSISCSNKKSSIWFEVILLGCLAIVLPGTFQILSNIYQRVLSGMGGVDLILTNSAATIMANYCAIPAYLGQILAYVTCGMSIAYKKLSPMSNQTIQ